MFIKQTPERIERRHNLTVITDVLDVLNRIDTSVNVQDGKYIVSQNADKKYEIAMNESNAVIRAFNNEKNVTRHLIFAEGAQMKVKLWMLKCELSKATETDVLKNLSGKMKELKVSIDLINNVLTIISNPGATVDVLNETMVMKKYKVTSADGKSFVIEYNGYMAKINDVLVKCHGYMGWKMNVLRRDLDKFIEKSHNTQNKKLNILQKLRLYQR